MKPVALDLLVVVGFLASGFGIQTTARGEPSAQPTSGQPHSSPRHWSFEPAGRPAIPRVQNGQWARNPIDAFVLAALEKENLAPSPEADRRTIIRRLSFDLLGLPPKTPEVEAFVADLRPEAYELLVDQLLASPHFGERWGRHWLDLARYADSDGYEKDSVRPYAYLYRDWVIDAINRDVPFDQFSIEQLAGDLLPNATEAQKVATGFHRNTLTNKEGGVDQEEFRCKATVDRVSTTSTVWLGLTVGCAECHTHKYDPISQREFYQLYAFFNNTSEADVPAPRPAELAKYTEEKRRWDNDHNRIQAELQAYLKSDATANQIAWEQTTSTPGERWTILSPLSAASAGGATLNIEADRSIRATGNNPATDRYLIEASPGLSSITGFRIEILDDPAPGKGPGRSKNNNFVLSEFTVRIESLNAGTTSSSAATVTLIPVTLRNASADYSPRDWPASGALDGDPKTGWAIDPQFDRRHVAVFETTEDLALPPDAKLIFRLDQNYGAQHTIGSFRISTTSSPQPLRAHLMPDSIVEALAKPREERADADAEALTRFYLSEIDPAARALNRKLADHAKQAPKFPETKAQTMAENQTPRNTHIHVRGDFLRKGDEVQPGTLAVMHAFKPRSKVGQASRLSPVHPSTESKNSLEPREKAGETPALPDRLDLAEWLFDPANSLTARVTVNRVWAHLFGRGLVATLNDFGTRGETPSHPELLDWLANEFRRLGWSRKKLIKRIVMSSAYRQSSNPRPDLAERDPNNVWLARQNRFRMEAEAVRDAFLAAAGLISPAIGGPSVRPPMPADIAALGYANSVKWKESEGPDRYRRGLYIHFQRTVPYPMLMTFDAPDSNVTCTHRERSNTPLQALTLLNDPVFFECAQALGRRIVSEVAGGPDERIRRGFARCLSREPTDEEMSRLTRLYKDYASLIQKRPEGATRIVGTDKIDPDRIAETASLIGVARTILNLDEFVTRE